MRFCTFNLSEKYNISLWNGNGNTSIVQACRLSKYTFLHWLIVLILKFCGLSKHSEVLVSVLSLSWCKFSDSFKSLGHCWQESLAQRSAAHLAHPPLLPYEQHLGVFTSSIWGDQKSAAGSLWEPVIALRGRQSTLEDPHCNVKGRQPPGRRNEVKWEDDDKGELQEYAGLYNESWKSSYCIHDE